MDSFKKKIAVLGGGFVGILSTASLKEEGGFDVVCFEKTSKYGGTWCYREESEEGVPSIMPTTIINHSKEMGALSNFPPPKEYNNFMRHHELHQYITEYATEKDILKHFRFNTEVKSVQRAPDYEETGRWTVTVRNTLTEEVTTDVYDGVLVGVGHINRPKMPIYPGQDQFKGKILHSHSLKGVAPYRGKTVVVVGMGCSGLDAAVETSNVAKQVYLSTRSGAHVINRIGPKGLPYDYTLIRPYIYQLLDIFPPNFVGWLLETCYLDFQYDHKLYAIKPDHHIFSKDPILNDYIGSKLLSGAVIMKPDIQCFTEDGVIFEGDSEVTQADVVIMATGYTWKFPFLEEGIIEKENDKINLYKCMFPPQLPHATLIFIGFILPFGPGFPLGELQCRWAVQVLAGKCKLPSKKKMYQDIKKMYEINCKRYPPSEKRSLRVDYISYCDDIASQFGAKPNLLKLFFTDIKLFNHIIFGPSLSYQYRLQGPHSWEGAREAIITCKDRILYPVTKRNSKALRRNPFEVLFQKTMRFIFF
ncbi:dimethylaniline monooxygenase 5 [Trichonephila inaurata madagascariensis]|uniref:Flavin-containing monooxygenase n=1 Tax=Trichonephila inaurata madagascariensis TaxID=2747483 RepID=A0A8X6JSG8_9ARAC|nr:dimethylaniline monooxygenase 5 [Trichonephila inaurata madagascariensis]